MKTKILLLALNLLTAVNVFAQKVVLEPDPGQEYTDRMNYIFEHVDKNKITTGLLVDYGLQTVEPEYFDGIPADSNYVDMDTWKMLYLGMYSSKINKFANLISPDDVYKQIEKAQYRDEHAVTVAIMHFQYNRLNENAEKAGLVKIVNDQIIETNLISSLKNPLYYTKQLFAAAPEKVYLKQNTNKVAFVFFKELFYTNTDKTVDKIEINFNNGHGWRPAEWGEPVTSSFDSPGIKTVYFRLTYIDGTSYTSQTNIMLKSDNEYILMSAGNNTIDTAVTISATSQHSGGKIQIKYSNYNSSKTIKKPLIVAEGFDASIITGKEYNMDINDFIYNEYPTSTGTININYFYNYHRNLYNEINLAEYDIVYLDYNNGVDDIWRNAQLFREVIEWVNANKEGVKPNVVMGISMGGLVARIALRKMELDGVEHQTWKYISMDSPHKGANVPLGFQAAVRHIQNTDFTIFFINILDYKDFDVTRNAVNLLNSVAVKQMLVYTVNSGYGFDNSVHDNFQSQYDQLGFPGQCINVAISNGSNSGSLIFPAGSNLVSMNASYSVKWWMDMLAWIFHPYFLSTNYPLMALINMVPGNSQLKADMSIHALKNQTASQIYYAKAYIKKKLLWFIPVYVTLTSKTINSTAGMLPLDGAPGGKYDLSIIGGELPFGNDIIKQQHFCFIPTVSSLALSDWQTKLTQPVTAAPAFHDMYAQSVNDLHTRFNSPALFLYNHLTENPYMIAGADTVYSLQQAAYTVRFLGEGINITWSGSSNVNIISGQGTSQVTVSVCGGNTATLTATLSGGVNQVLNKTIKAKTGNLSVIEYLDHVDVWLNNPYAQCYDWEISNSFYNVHVGTGYITCSNYNDLLLYPSGEDVYGFISVRARNGNCVSSWENASFSLWRPTLLGNFNPLRPEPLYAYVEDIPVPMINGAEFYWYFDGSLIAVTSEPSVWYWDWPCGDHQFSVVVNIEGKESLPSSTDFWGMCGSGGGWGVSSAYPNPAGNELIIDKETNSNEIAANSTINEQNSQAKNTTVKVLLYSHSTTQLVYSKDFSAAEQQIKIDTSKLPNGIYYLNIIANNEKIKEQTIIVNH
ncbi:MAG: T9SS type A sorting domain-containing protein [Prevotellaceae bacterium]|jgi:hypothetical protein|nr:T9SS type A sorting domain-containing protein [Prevotellaceae bacterium]